MKESDFVGNILIACEKIMPGGMGFKHHDTVTGGIPDLSWSWAQRTLWAEAKNGRNAKVSKIQRRTLQRLSRVTLALVLWNKPEESKIQIFTPNEILIGEFSNVFHTVQYLRKRMHEWCILNAT